VDAETSEAGQQPEAPAGGEWATVELLGHRQRAGYVTEVTRFGAAMLHIDLPAKLWGGDPDAWEEYAPAALYGLHPVNGEAVRLRWEQDRRWRQERLARVLTAGDDDDPDGDETCGCGDPDCIGCGDERNPF